MSEKIKVLYAEDEKDIRENISEILRDEGFEVIEASNGKEGIEAFLENEPDIVISDIMMPEVSGHEFLKIIRENDNIPNNNVPFILLTALNQKEDLIKGIDLKANDYLTKPIDFDLLIAKIKEKYANSKKIEQSHIKNISVIKDQVSKLLPSQLNKYLHQINHIAKALKKEPYGPLPHRKYAEDINHIYMNSVKIKSILSSFTNSEAINNQIKSNEEIINSNLIVSDFLKSLDDEISSKIQFLSNENNPDIKVSKKLIMEIFRKILKSILKIDQSCNTEISMVEDHMGQLVFIFYPKSNKVNESTISKLINQESLNEKIQSLGYSFDIFYKDLDTSMLLYIPNYRVVKD
jgi:CheY-like chemotaxis protein